MEKLIKLDFDKDDIELSGVSIHKAADLAKALELLFDAAYRSRSRLTGQTMGIAMLDGTNVFELRVAAEPAAGSIRIPTWVVMVATAGLGPAADISQITGVSISDGLAAIEHMGGKPQHMDEYSESFATAKQTRNSVANVVAKATATGCSYVGIVFENNPPVVIIGGGGQRMALIASNGTINPPAHQPHSLYLQGRGSLPISVEYAGRDYQAIVHAQDQSLPPYVLLWGSNKPLPTDADIFQVRVETIEHPEVIRHVGDIPDQFKSVQGVLLVTGASYENFD